MRRPASPWLLGAIAAALLWTPARAGDEAFDGAPLVLGEDELASVRGGLAIPLGLDIDFGAVVRTYVDGALALESKLNWTKGGPQTEVSTPAEARLIDNAAAAGLSAPAGDWTGVVVPGDGGETMVLQDVTADRIANLVVNTANNREVRQDITVDLGIADLEQMQADFAGQQLQLRLQDAIGSALRDAGLR